MKCLFTIKEDALFSILINYEKTLESFSASEGGWWSIRFQIRTLRGGIVGGKVGGIDKVDIGNLFAAAYVVEGNEFIVVEIDGIDKHVDDALAKFLIQRIAGTEFL